MLEKLLQPLYEMIDNKRKSVWHRSNILFLGSQKPLFADTENFLQGGPAHLDICPLAKPQLFLQDETENDLGEANKQTKYVNDVLFFLSIFCYFEP